ncbi:MAG: citrate synthase [Clostridia bacterium]|nr:citrate synthase [Clostridia bacterium]
MFETEKEREALIGRLSEDYRKNNFIDPHVYENYKIKRGLREPDGSGVMVGATRICSVRGYVIEDGDRVPAPGQLIYRGIDVNSLLKGYEAEGRCGFEEVVYLLLMGKLPTAQELEEFNSLLASVRELPENFTEDMIIKAPSRDVMNKMARSVLALYSYDNNPDDISLQNLLRQSIQLIARLPIIAVQAYQVKKRHYDKESMYLHVPSAELGTAENFLHIMRKNQKFTPAEARLLDACLIMHAEHGAGNNSAFTTRVLSSTGTDTYSAIAASIGSLKGPRHGGANLQVCNMMDDIKKNVSNWKDDEEVLAYLCKILRKEAGDGSGLIYGMGHAVYTLSDPRAAALKARAGKLAEEKGMGDEFHLIESVERLAGTAFSQVRGGDKIICANVDLYSGFIYRMLGIPTELYTPLFTIARVAGWCSHRVEELSSGSKVIRPAYKFIGGKHLYVPINNRK